MLSDFSKTPSEWGELDIVEQQFLREAYNEKVRRQEEKERNAG